jgi:hypothetical protein
MAQFCSAETTGAFENSRFIQGLFQFTVRILEQLQYSLAFPVVHHCPFNQAFTPSRPSLASNTWHHGQSTEGQVFRQNLSYETANTKHHNIK